MDDYTETIKEICRAIVSTLYRKDHSDKTFKAQITENIGNSKYKVLYTGNTYIVSSSINLQAGDYVRICAPCNNWDDLFVVCKTK